MSSTSSRYGKPLEQATGSAHPDYAGNLRRAESFVERVQCQLLKGMRCYISDSQYLQKCCIDMCFIPPFNAKMGRFVTSISLHQPSDGLSKEIDKTFTAYKKMAENFNNNEEFL